jgi:uncharacterized protein (DUF427 family)
VVLVNVVPKALLAARQKWVWVGDERPPWASTPNSGQISVWDFPRPPRLEREERRVRVEFAGRGVAESDAAWRVLETASPPTIYVPLTDVDHTLLHASGAGSVCEWKGRAAHLTLRVGGRESEDAAWSYADPFPEFERLAEAIAFHPGRVDRCTLGGVDVESQAGGYYGGWITADLAGPFKGPRGTQDW